MLLKADASQLEWRTKVFLSQDPVGLREIQNNEDLHSDNQKLFRLPNRTVAKNFLYRMIFADAFGERSFSGPAYAYANDPDFSHVSPSTRYWEEVVGRFFQKYAGIYSHGVASIRTACETGLLTAPTGRFYKFKPYQYASGEWDWPRTNILNYPVQGLAADFMILARKLAWRAIPRSPEILFISTVHDDIELDIDNDPVLCYNICKELEKCFTQIPQEFEKLFGVKINVPFAGEVKLGWTLFEDDMVKFNSKDFDQIWASVLTKQPSLP
jgi:DNA polymerase I-like protein with 3'-5' exonuclease and polymerase domains